MGSFPKFSEHLSMGASASLSYRYILLKIWYFHRKNVEVNESSINLYFLIFHYTTWAGFTVTIFKGYLLYKTLFYHKVARDAQSMNFISRKKPFFVFLWNPQISQYVTSSFWFSLIYLFKKTKHWNLGIIGYWVIGAGC